MRADAIKIEIARLRKTSNVCPDVLDIPEDAVTSVYSVLLRDYDGTLLATFNSWKRLIIKRFVNRPDEVTFSIWGGDDRKSFFLATTS